MPSLLVPSPLETLRPDSVKLMPRPLLKVPTMVVSKPMVMTGNAISASVNFPKLNYQSAHASSLSSQVSVQVWTQDTLKRHLPSSKVFWLQSPTLNTHRSANQTAAHVRRKLMPHITMRQRTEPSSFKAPSQSSRPWERSKLDKPEKTAREDQRRPQSAKPTTTMVVSNLETSALLPQYAHHPSKATVATTVEKVLVLPLDQNDKNYEQCRL